MDPTTPGSDSTRLLYRCAGPNCGVLRGDDDRGWLMWTSYGDWGVPVLLLSAWNDEIAHKEGTLYVCGENCAHKLQSQFMNNLRLERERREAETSASSGLLRRTG